MTSGDYALFELGDLTLQSGVKLPGAKLAYKTIGTFNEAKDNAIVLPHMYTGTAAFMTAYVAIDAIYAEALA